MSSIEVIRLISMTVVAPTMQAKTEGQRVPSFTNAGKQCKDEVHRRLEVSLLYEWAILILLMIASA